MLHGATELLLGNAVVVVVKAGVDDPGVDVALRNSTTFTQNCCVPAATTAALQISRDTMRMLTIRKTGFSAVRTYAMCQSFICLHHMFTNQQY